MPMSGSIPRSPAMIGVSYQTDYPDNDIGAVLDFILEKGPALGRDKERIGILACWGNAQTGLIALTEKRAERTRAVRCGIVNYPVLSCFMNKGEEIMPPP
jgi:hypothetical protein